MSENVRPLRGSRPPWTTDSEGRYSRDKFYVRATNGYDHSNKMRVHLPPDAVAAAEEVVAQIPAYRGVADLLRDALYHRVHYLATERHLSTPIIDRWLDLEAGQAAIDRARVEIEMHKSIVTDARRTLDDLIAAGDRGQALLMLEALEPTLDAMRDPWHSQLAKIITTAYRQLRS